MSGFDAYSQMLKVRPKDLQAERSEMFKVGEQYFTEEGAALIYIVVRKFLPQLSPMADAIITRVCIAINAAGYTLTPNHPTEQ